MKELGGVVDFVKPMENSNPAWLYFVVEEKKQKEFKKKLLKEGVDLNEMYTFRCLGRKSKKALKTEQKVLTFALYRDFDEIKCIINKIKKVCSINNGKNE